MVKTGSVVFAAALTALSLSSAHAATHVFSRYDFPGAQQTSAHAINDSGQIAGSYRDANFDTHGFVDTAGTLTTIDVPPGGFTFVDGISNTGRIAGASFSFPNLAAFTGVPGALTTFSGNGESITGANGVNSAGLVVGVYGTGTANMAFTYQAGVFAPLTIPGLADPSFVNANGVNDSGAIVGAYARGFGNGGLQISGFLDVGGVFTQIDVPGALQTYAEGISTSGLIVGTYNDASFHQRGFIYDDGAFTLIDLAGGPGNTQLYSINDAGVIVGEYSTPDFTTDYTFIARPGVTSTPEPASAAIAAVALIALGLTRRPPVRACG